MGALFSLSIFLLVLVLPRPAVGQSLKGIRVGSSNISVTNLVTFYARDRNFSNPKVLTSNDRNFLFRFSRRELEIAPC